MYGNLKRGEDTEQMGVIDWANWNLQRFPELKMLYHVPNGGKRNPAEAARFKAMGVKAGVPDLCLPVPMNGYAGLYIEMKYGSNKPTAAQKEWILQTKVRYLDYSLGFLKPFYAFLWYFLVTLDNHNSFSTPV